MLGQKDYDALLASIKVFLGVGVGGGVTSRSRELCRRNTRRCCWFSAHQFDTVLQTPTQRRDNRPLESAAGGGQGPLPKLLRCLCVVSAQTQSSAAVNLWVAVPTVDWQHIMTLGFEKADAWLEHSDALIGAAVAEAADAGFPLVGKPEGGPRGDATHGASRSTR